MHVLERVNYTYTSLTQDSGFDEFITRIPNQELANRRLCNVSRLKKCRIKFDLPIQHSDLEKVTPLCAEIKATVKKECPELISDGTRPFRVTMRQMLPDHLLVVIDSHFNLPPVGEAYYNNLHHVLELVGKVLQKNQITLATPQYRLATSSDNDALSGSINNR